MPVEIKNWQTRCDRCGDVYGNYWDTQEEAQASHDEGGGLCDECAEETTP